MTGSWHSPQCTHILPNLFDFIHSCPYAVLLVCLPDHLFVFCIFCQVSPETNRLGFTISAFALQIADTMSDYKCANPELSSNGKYKYWFSEIHNIKQYHIWLGWIIYGLMPVQAYDIWPVNPIGGLDLILRLLIYTCLPRCDLTNFSLPDGCISDHLWKNMARSFPAQFTDVQSIFDWLIWDNASALGKHSCVLLGPWCMALQDHLDPKNRSDYRLLPLLSLHVGWCLISQCIITTSTMPSYVSSVSFSPHIHIFHWISPPLSCLSFLSSQLGSCNSQVVYGSNVCPQNHMWGSAMIGKLFDSYVLPLLQHLLDSCFLYHVGRCILCRGGSLCIYR